MGRGQLGPCLLEPGIQLVPLLVHLGASVLPLLNLCEEFLVKLFFLLQLRREHLHLLGQGPGSKRLQTKGICFFPCSTRNSWAAYSSTGNTHEVLRSQLQIPHSGRESLGICFRSSHLGGSGQPLGLEGG